MIRFLIMLIEILVCYLLQSSVFTMIPLAGVVPDIILILVVSVAYMRGRIPGLFCGFLAGLLMDFCYNDNIGLCALLYMIIGFLNGYGNKLYHREGYAIPIIFIGISEFIYETLYYVFEFLLRGRMNYSHYLTEIILPRMVYTIFAAVLFYWLFHMVHQKLLRLDKKEE